MAAKDILFLDAYDSFTYNIVSLLAEALPLEPDARIVVRSLNDTIDGHDAPLTLISDDLFHEYIRGFRAVICGPGPGSPLNPEHVGPFTRLWDLADENLVPVLGICLGFQSLVARFGGTIRKLKLGQHGIIRSIDHQGASEDCQDIFRGVSSFKATLYHSLCGDIGQDTVPDEEWPRKKWTGFKAAPLLQPLAWTTTEHARGTERVLMAVKHIEKPFWGLQYHPESICTEPEGRKVLQNWFAQAETWNKRCQRLDRPTSPAKCVLGHGVLPTSIQSKIDSFVPSEGKASDGVHVFADDWLGNNRPDLSSHAPQHYFCEELELPAGVDTARMRAIVNQDQNSQVILDSSSSRIKDPLATQSIIAMDVDHAIRFEHKTASDDIVRMFVPAASQADEKLPPQEVDLQCQGGISAWEIISHFWSARHERYTQSPQRVGSGLFSGGFMGYLSYEMGLQAVSPEAMQQIRRTDHADMCLAWITHSIVLDHKRQRIRIQAWGGLDSVKIWVSRMVTMLSTALLSGTDDKNSLENGHIQADESRVKGLSYLRIRAPDPAEYERKVRVCQEQIAEGNSYELCLTQQTIMTRPRSQQPARVNGATMKDPALLSQTRSKGRNQCQYHGATDHQGYNGHSNGNDTLPGQGESEYISRVDAAWHIYKTLRSRQPAPFGSFICLGGATLLSSSPERFLKYDANGHCSMRPMKGTVRKSTAVKTLADAEKMLRVPKEIAENLMIVDLVRHDLHRVCGYGQVSVPEPFKIEEYATVFTMVTGIDGKLNQYNTGATGGDGETPASAMTGLDVLRSVFPPGSMTGAPKKRSCELLADIEQHEPRGLYSGVVGYMDITGAGDWSVTIRSMFRYDDEDADAEPGETEKREVWHIGAGGAVTILSTPEGERDEMFTKLEGPLGVFRDVA